MNDAVTFRVHIVDDRRREAPWGVVGSLRSGAVEAWMTGAVSGRRSGVVVDVTNSVEEGAAMKLFSGLPVYSRCYARLRTTLASSG
jgi:hypothetical protein